MSFEKELKFMEVKKNEAINKLAQVPWDMYMYMYIG